MPRNTPIVLLRTIYSQTTRNPKHTPKDDQPLCEECDHCQTVRDPYATGDWWYEVLDCTQTTCPFGKTEMDD